MITEKHRNYRLKSSYSLANHKIKNLFVNNFWIPYIPTLNFSLHLNHQICLKIKTFVHIKLTWYKAFISGFLIRTYKT